MESARTEKFNYTYEGNQMVVSLRQTNEIGIATVRESQRQLAQTVPVSLVNEQFDNTAVLTNIEQINLDKDKVEFSKLFEHFTAKLERENRDRYPKPRRCNSFDENVMREWYDDLAPESDFHSDLSRESFPHDYKETKMGNPGYLARLELFRLTIKSKYQFDNVYAHRAGASVRVSMDNLRNITRRTQTYEKDIAIGYDPFDKEGVLFYNEEERMMEYDPEFAKDILFRVIENYSEESYHIEQEGNGDKKGSDEDGEEFDF